MDTLGSTAHISPTQLLALSQFVTFVEEPEVLSDNYVSKLQEFVQKRHLDMPQFTMESLNVPVAGKYRPRWRCICSLPWSGEKFPEPGEGAIGLFVNSKEAKQFAAMKAFAHVAGHPTQDVSAASFTSSVTGPSVYVVMTQPADTSQSDMAKIMHWITR
ncbi:hypothetical protein LMH87_009431 [Akanthomyces muscarius]|uniref:DRBM domain-containing protein n=1 Tax=Akanthomyces muscarius TaxID=2231603 RepID=A0A9W8QBB8_AKAMU|nr:hypothetical protein LMH87_009431 [Akanthomyces muscarius]KAJ4152913.1 hypothetical protein LMH87_009431 [Akanthomyces muscarius]